MRSSLFSVADHRPAGPRSAGGVYRQMPDEILPAERLGFAGFFVTEHRVHGYGLVPSPRVRLASFGAIPDGRVHATLARFTTALPGRVDALLHEPAAAAGAGGA